MIEKEYKWNVELLDSLSFQDEEWQHFRLWQKARILERLGRYNNAGTVKSQLEERGDLTPYQKYKINVVSTYLYQALKLIETGEYGYCLNCRERIPAQRLLLVPGALNCMGCESSKPKYLK